MSPVLPDSTLTMRVYILPTTSVACRANLAMHLLVPPLPAKSAPVAGFKTRLVTPNLAHCVPRVHLLLMTVTIIRTTIPSKIASLVHPGNTVPLGHCFATSARLAQKHLKMPPPTKPLVCCAAVVSINPPVVRKAVLIVRLECIKPKMGCPIVFHAFPEHIQTNLVPRNARHAV